ncbi:MAG: DNA glycosylase [Chlorobiaceae bacterium]
MYRYSIKLDNPIDLQGTLFSGQSFMWNNVPGEVGLYAAVVSGVPLVVSQQSTDELDVHAASNEICGMDVPDFIRHYFTDDVQYEGLFPETFSKRFIDVWELLPPYFHLKVLRQQFFETMITFMCAQGIGMHLIRRQVSMLSMRYGKRMSITLGGQEIVLYGSPAPEPLASADPRELCKCTNNNRIRAANIIESSKAIASGQIDSEALKDPDIPINDLRNMLSCAGGIGYKIADCMALFGLGRFDAFPVDTHVRQYMGTWFGSQSALRSLTPAGYLLIDADARSILNPLMAGYAGHLLFHCWRKEVRKLQSF